jgi:KDO2-lipid IV(A) lauroyltransferase
MYYVIYGLLYILSLLPFNVLYLISDFLYVLLYYVIRYRLDIVKNNLLIAFPEKTQKERTAIAKQFYKNLVDTFIETIKLISISDKKFLQRCSDNFEILKPLIEKGKNIQLQSAHQFNWEYGNRILSIKIKVPVAGVYMPLKNKAVNKLFMKFRSHLGIVLVDATHYSKDIKKVARRQHVLALIADQNPGVPSKAYWLNFFNSPAPFLIGPERGAIKNNNAIVFTRFVKIKRGHYHFENHIITENASDFKPGEITKKFRDFIQDAISKDPPGFLWSHRRWKHTYKKEYERLWIDDMLPNSLRQ